MKNVCILFFLILFNVGNAQIINFPDPNFKWALKTTICADSNGDGIHDRNADFNNDGEIDLEEALKIVHLRIDNRQIANLEGIQYFKNLTRLDCYNNILTLLNEVNANNLPKLRSIDCSRNNIQSLNLENFPELNFLNFESNGCKNTVLKNLPKMKIIFGNSNSMISLQMLELPNLEELYINLNNLQEMKLAGLLKLKELECQYNIFKILDLRNLPSLVSVLSQYNRIEEVFLDEYSNLEFLAIYKNKLKYLVIKNQNKLKFLSCSYGEITSIRLENLPNLESFDCFSNQLVSLFIKSGSYFNKGLYFEKNPDLTYICTEEYNISKVKELASKNGQVTCEVNSYCSFTPGGTFYLLNGENKSDGNVNGCDDQDVKIPNIKYKLFQNNNLTGLYIANSTGNYSIPVQEGTHTITPILEYPDHFEVTPASYTVTFPSTSDTIIQNFCFSPKGIFSKLKITILPLSPPARPGFEAKYKIVWENVGNQIESGTLNFTYDETLLDYISATQTADQVADGIVKWNFSNLLPFEKREITVTLKVNRPTDTPAVNAGDKLYMTASILDNIFTLENTVVGSIDPNDKTCLQGDRVHPDMIGKYVDYLIRFENTGTYAAENVVVKDIIDTKRYDVSTLQITDASHEVYTRIEGNKVEFIFENIQLPFDDANNDGYIAFKIKTLSTLQLGDSLKNLADIYFDYNFPIRTNEAQTTVALPSFTQEWVSDVNVYPNPVSDILTFETKEAISKVEVYSLEGRIFRSMPVTQNQINLRDMESGTYIAKVFVSTGTSYVKIVKL
ncbi:MAG: T9SS type A sorting domain-containing protein [Saprospiraceae bacterium]|nr:T9SS type A sorting domain-containing protein [Saprospiraceae bacterium]MBK7698134.1 T9SS type A sorting domain-containing protein [Saprospiraceae bacterium]MBK8827716.1 T9SS type A sorting domain-containing protein [Saprospiraceae bacterium]MBK9583352.1 T9SS type A sorting domain-containing protein [Saprospiraceae bacterium]